MPIEPAEEFVFLRHAPCVTLSKERLKELCLRGSVRKPPEPQWLRAHLLVPGPWLAPESGREPRIGSRLLLIENLRLGRAVEPLAEATGVLGLGLTPWCEGRRERTRWV